VTLDFNQRRIQVSSASEVPVIFVGESNDVFLENVEIEAVETAQYLVSGVDIITGKNVTVNSPRFHNLNMALYAENVDGLDILDLYLNNDEPLPIGPDGDNQKNSLVVYNSDKVKYYDAKTNKAKSYFASNTNVDVQRLRADNLNVLALFCLEFNSVALTNKEVNPDLPSPRTTRNVHVSGCELMGADWTGFNTFENGTCLRVAGPSNCEAEGTNNFIIENNVITAQTRGIEISGSYGGIVRGNQITVIPSSLGQVIGSCVELNGKTWRVENNNFSSNISEDATIFLSVGLIMSFDDDCQVGSSYNYILNNTASMGTGSVLIPTEGFRASGGSASFCNIYSENIAVGNDINYDIIPTNVVLPNNVDECEGGVPPAALLKEDSRYELVITKFLKEKRE
jgi:parallel beta-helix repeat protein